MSNKTRMLGKQYARALVAPTTLNKESREFDVVFATETPVFRWGWDENYNEILSCEDSAILKERINNGLPVMDCHNTWSVFSQLGRTVKVWVDEVKREVWATIRLSSGERLDDLMKDIEDGIVRDISVGYMVHKFIREPQAEGEIPIYRAVSWMPTEISFAPVQADVNSGVRSNEGKIKVQIINKRSQTTKIRNMITITCPECDYSWETEKADQYTCPECGAIFSIDDEGRAEEDGESEGTNSENIQSAAEEAQAVADEAQDTADAAQTVADELQAIADGDRSKGNKNLKTIIKATTDAERKRYRAIALSVRTAKLPESTIGELYDSTRSINECRQEIIKRMVNNDPKPNSGHSAKIGVEAIEKKRQGITNAILHRVQPSRFKLEGGSREFRGMTLIEMGKELLTERGIAHRGLGKAEIANIMLSRTHSSSDFPILFEDAMEKLLRADYEFAPEFWDRIAKQTTVSDFREKSLYQVESENGMKEVPEGGEIKYTRLIEGKSSIRVKSFAEGIKFTRQAIINDDLGALEIIPNRFVKDWDELRGELVWGLIIDNVKLSDGKALFSTDHNNLLTGASSALSETSLASMYKIFKSQKALGSDRRIRVIPKQLIVPIDLEPTAKKLLASVTATRTDDVNIFANDLELIVEPRLEDPTAWYLQADPNAVDNLYYAYLDGESGLRVNNEENFNTDSIDYAVRSEFGASAVDFRGIAKSNGK